MSDGTTRPTKKHCQQTIVSALMRELKPGIYHPQRAAEIAAVAMKANPLIAHLTSELERAHKAMREAGEFMRKTTQNGMLVLSASDELVANGLAARLEAMEQCVKRGEEWANGH